MRNLQEWVLQLKVLHIKQLQCLEKKRKKKEVWTLGFTSSRLKIYFYLLLKKRWDEMTLMPKNKRPPSSLNLYCTNNYKTCCCTDLCQLSVTQVHSFIYFPFPIYAKGCESISSNFTAVAEFQSVCKTGPVFLGLCLSSVVLKITQTLSLDCQPFWDKHRIKSKIYRCNFSNSAFLLPICL